MFHPVPPVAHHGPNHDVTHDMDAEGEHDMDIDPSPSPSAQNGQQSAVRHDQYTSSDAEADGDFEDDDTASLSAARPVGYTNGVATALGGGQVVGARSINFATVDPALYGLRRSVRTPGSAFKNLTIDHTDHLVLSSPAGTASRGTCRTYRCPELGLSTLSSSSFSYPQYNGDGSDASDEDEDDFDAPKKPKSGPGGGSKIRTASRPKGTSRSPPNGINHIKSLKSYLFVFVVSTQGAEGGDSSEDDYGSSSAVRKRRKPHSSNSALASTSTSDVRISSRGQKIPNYADDGGFHSDEFLEDDDGVGEAVDQGPVEPTGYTADGQPLYEASDEIDGVYGHYRDEEYGAVLSFTRLVLCTFLLIMQPFSSERP